MVEVVSGRDVLLDANLLLLLAVGSVARERISRFKRTAHFEANDYDLLQDLVSQTTHLLTTPHVLTEVSNLGGQLHGLLRERFYRILSRLVLTSLDERHLPAADAVADTAYTRLGLTDSALLRMSETGVTVVSVDLDLCLELQRRGMRAVNFNHLRSQRLTRPR